MAENTASAKCTEFEWEAARAAGLLFCDPGTTTQERALHKFAEAMRADLLAELRKVLPLTGRERDDPEVASAYAAIARATSEGQQ